MEAQGELFDDGGGRLLEDVGGRGITGRHVLFLSDTRLRSSLKACIQRSSITDGNNVRYLTAELLRPTNGLCGFRSRGGT